jgi:hypothetical protein
MRRPLALSLALLLGSALAAAASGERPADEIRPRVEHHLREAEQLARQVEASLSGPCPRFASRQAWDAYLDGNVERIVTLVAHLEQAWEEAKQTADKDVRREAKAPRGQVNRIPTLVARLQACADGAGARVEPDEVWRRIEREVPQRQGEIALPPVAPPVAAP